MRIRTGLLAVASLAVAYVFLLHPAVLIVPVFLMSLYAANRKRRRGVWGRR